MKITEVSILVARNDLRQRLWNPKLRWGVKSSVLVVVHTDADIDGIGECWCFDAAPDALIAFLRTEVIPQLIGADPLRRQTVRGRLWDGATLSARHGIMASALSGIDIALWDIAAKRQGIPLYRLLGGESPWVSVYASGGLYAEGKSESELARELQGYVAQGFDCVKLKVGGLSMAEDVARVRHVRAALGDAVGIIVDGVYSFARATAAAFFAEIEGQGIHAFQSPLSASDIAGMAALKGTHRVPVMGLEAEYREPIFEQLLRSDAVSILQFAVIACGGVTVGLQLLDAAAARGIPCSLECSSTAVAQMAAFHLGAARPNVEAVEYHMVHQALFDRFPAEISDLVGGRLRLPDRPGLGIELPQTGLERHR